MKTKLLIVALCLSFLPFSSQASKLYVLYDAKCMDKLEYDYTQSNDNYTVYHVNVSNGEKVILEVGRESKDAVSNLPTPFIGCSNGTFDLRLVDRINKRIDEVFMVYPRGNRYFVSPITFASYYEHDDQQITYISPKYMFKFDRKQGAIGENISTRKNAKVYFEGQLENDCNGILLFRQFSNNSSMAHTDLMLVPEVGIVEERSGANLEDAQNNALKIDDVNGKSYDRYLRSICNNPSAVSDSYTSMGDIPQEANVTPVFPTPNQPDLVRKDGSAQPVSYDSAPAQKSAATFHTVKKGETLYAISRKYDVTVSQIKNWNNKSGNMIRTGENLRISDQNDTPAAQPEMTAKSGNVSWQATKTTSQAIAKQPTPASNASTTQEYHIVRAGETVPSIAMKYGFTEAKFREMNNLGANQFIKIGQQLKTNDCNCPAASDSPAVFNPVPAYEEDLTPRSVEPTPYSQPVYPSGYGTTSTSNTPTAYSATQGRINTNNYNSSSYQPENTTPKGGVQYYDTPVPQPTAPATSNNYYSSGSNGTSNYYPSSYPTTPSGYQGTNQPDFDQPVMPQSYESVNTSFRSSNVTTKGGKRTTHLVGEGETLYSIARKYGVSVEHLREVNNLERSEVIIPYQRIFIN